MIIFKFREIRVLTIAALAIVLTACAPMRIETDGAVGVYSSQFEAGRILVSSSTGNLNSCTPQIETCLRFQRELIRDINSIGKDQAFSTRDTGLSGKGVNNIEEAISLAKSLDAQYVLYWTSGESEDRASFSFGPDRFAVAELKVVNVTSAATVWSLTKEYSLSASNTGELSILVDEVAQKLATLLANR